MIHYNSPWSHNDLLVFDCANTPEEFHEAYLFGNEGTESAGMTSRAGLVEKAHLGTLVIANVHGLNNSCQTRLARVLREQKSQRLNGRRFYPAYIRLLATSNEQSFGQMLETQEFHSDFQTILLENIVFITPLRERQEDIPFLITANTKRVAQAWGKTISSIDPLVMERLMKFDFLGNTKELEALVESAVCRCEEMVLRLKHFAAP